MTKAEITFTSSPSTGSIPANGKTRGQGGLESRNLKGEPLCVRDRNPKKSAAQSVGERFAAPPSPMRTGGGESCTCSRMLQHRPARTAVRFGLRRRPCSRSNASSSKENLLARSKRRSTTSLPSAPSSSPRTLHVRRPASPGCRSPSEGPAWSGGWRALASRRWRSGSP